MILRLINIITDLKKVRFCPQQHIHLKIHYANIHTQKQMRPSASLIMPYCECSAVQSQNTVTAYFTSKQLLPSGFPQQY